jgi:hypothetical protein
MMRRFSRIALGWGLVLSALFAAAAGAWAQPEDVGAPYELVRRDSEPSVTQKRSDVKVNPYGPTVTNPATLTNVGLPEYEVFQASLSGGSGFDRQRQTQMLVKYTWHPRWMVSVGSNGFVTQLGPPQPGEAFGDPTVSVKYLLAPLAEKQMAQALQLSYKIPVGNTVGGINTGKPDVSLFWLGSVKQGHAELDVNVWLTSLGAPDARRLQLNASTALAVRIARHLYYQGEISRFGSAGPLQGAVSQTLHALSYNASSAINVSAGVQFGLTAAAPARTYIAGIVFYVNPPHASHGDEKKPQTSMSALGLPTR